jgi:hypothetical protein
LFRISDNSAQRFSLVTGVSRFFPSPNLTASPGVAVVRRKIN